MRADDAFDELSSLEARARLHVEPFLLRVRAALAVSRFPQLGRRAQALGDVGVVDQGAPAP